MTTTAAHAHEGTYGAKRISWRDENPREVLRRIVDQTHDNAEQLSAFIEWVSQSPARVEVIAEYYFANTIRLLDQPDADRRHRQRSIAASAALVQGIKARAKAMVLLDLPMPGGGTLRSATGAECAAVGGWLLAVSVKLGPDRVVGDHLSEADLQALFAQS